MEQPDNLPNPTGDDIFVGFWQNRLFNHVQGATLTLDRQRGALLIAFVALFVAASGRGFWKLVRFLLHFFHSTQQQHDGIYHQTQAILRNDGLALDAAQELLWATRVWRGRAKRSAQRLTPIAVVATVISLGFMAAGTVPQPRSPIM